MTAEPPPDALPPRNPPRHMTKGLLAACGLATVVFVVAVVAALRAESPGLDTEVATGTSTLRNEGEPSISVSVSAGGLPIGADTLPRRDTIGAHAPTESYERFEGGRASLANYRGKPIVVNFFSSRCLPCHTEMPELEKVHQARGDQVAFVGLNVLDSDEGARYLIEKTGVTWDLGKDPQGSIAVASGGLGLPTTMIVDADGIIRYLHTGQISADELERALQEVGI
ncbi:MAG: TlpA family protein disulfide reductase [Acidimicrobiales bacterium]|nr:TlpA family protein disulfide reductase [Acidimicrobiales bacterium]